MKLFNKLGIFPYRPEVLFVDFAKSFTSFNDKALVNLPAEVCNAWIMQAALTSIKEKHARYYYHRNLTLL